jgi:hypothetical protein
VPFGRVSAPDENISAPSHKMESAPHEKNLAHASALLDSKTFKVSKNDIDMVIGSFC